MNRLSNPLFRSIGEHVQRLYRDQWELSVDGLLKSLRDEKFAIERHEVVAAFQHFAKTSLGSFVVGRRGRPSRMQWRTLPKNLTFGNGSSDNDTLVPSMAEMLEYPLVLRPGITAKLVLPADLSVAESARIAEYVQRLPLAAH